MNIKGIFGENLRTVRKKKGLTQEQFAEVLGTSLNHIANMERGEKFVSAELLETICETLKVSPSALFYSPELVSIDNSVLSKIDKIIDEQCKMTRKLIHDSIEFKKK